MLTPVTLEALCLLLLRYGDASCARSAMVQSQPANAADKEKVCRAYAASFYESVMLREVAAKRVDGAQVLAALDSVINAFNNLLATRCGG